MTAERNKLHEESSLRDVLNTLDKPVDYLVGVFSNMLAYKKERQLDDAAVRIGRTGEGKAPNYRIEPTLKMVEALLLGDTELEAYKVAFNGRSHRPWVRDKLRAVSWSDHATPISEVRQMLGELRGFNKGSKL